MRGVRVVQSKQCNGLLVIARVRLPSFLPHGDERRQIFTRTFAALELATMQQFLQDNFPQLLPIFQALAYTDEQFFNLQTNVIAAILKNHQEVILDFILKLETKKTGNSINMSVEEMEFIDSSDALYDSNQIPQNHITDFPVTPESRNSPNPSPSSNNTSSFINEVPSQALMPTDEVTFIENDLFKLLNSTLKGKVVLGKYQKSKFVDIGLLKDVFIWGMIGEDMLHYKIDKNTFEKLLVEIVELFPTIEKDIDLLFEDKSTSANRRECVYTRGSFYNYYKTVRSTLREAGILNKTNCRKSSLSQSNIFEEMISENADKLSCLTNQEGNNPANEVISGWEQIYDQRTKLLQKKEKKVKVVSLASYYLSFPCLKHPLGIVLLAQDFKHFVKDLEKYKLVEADIVPQVDSLFVKTWPAIADKIIKAANNHVANKKSTIAEVADFMRTHKELITTDKHNSVLALFLLPWLIKTAKTYKISQELTLTLNKKQISDCFILHVKEAANLQTEQKEFENWINSLNQEIYPYLIFCGNLDNVKCYLVINNEKYVFADPLQAVENCYKCLTALYVFPSMCDFVWAFIDKAIYKISCRKTIAAVTNFYNLLNEQNNKTSVSCKRVR